jgi:hypothetical protein
VRRLHFEPWLLHVRFVMDEVTLKYSLYEFHLLHFAGYRVRELYATAALHSYATRQIFYLLSFRICFYYYYWWGGTESLGIY